jgi:hypothetical protein
MSYITPAALLIAGLIHLLPLSGILGPSHLARLYGIAFDQPDLAILMRHRAVLFGLLAIFLIYAVFRHDLRTLALLAAILSTASFIVLAWLTGDHSATIARVVLADWIALAALLLGTATHLALSR